MKRKVKILFLKNIDSGLVSLNDLKPRHLKIEVNTSTGKGIYYINGKVVDSEKYIQAINNIDSESNITILVDGRELK